MYYIKMYSELLSYTVYYSVTISGVYEYVALMLMVIDPKQDFR
jgi:hypothetical protein